jgi:hypothetical protein
MAPKRNGGIVSTCESSFLPGSDILVGLQSAEIIAMDRWQLITTLSTEHPPSGKGVDKARRKQLKGLSS